MPRRIRSRARYAAAAVVTIVLGLLVHVRGEVLGPIARDVAGDALWAMMIVWWVGTIAPGARLLRRCAAAYAICAAVEISQMYHAPWIDALRSTTLVQLVLGSGYDARDLVAYALGVAAAALIETAILLAIHRPNEQ